MFGPVLYVEKKQNCVLATSYEVSNFYDKTAVNFNLHWGALLYMTTIRTEKIVYMPFFFLVSSFFNLSIILQFSNGQLNKTN